MSIPASFLKHASDILADTERGVSGSVIVRLTSAYAVQHGIDIPHVTKVAMGTTKRTALLENLLPFPPEVQYRILRDLCDHGTVTHPKRAELKVMLLTRYGHLDGALASETVDEVLVVETRHWLGDYPIAHTLYEGALLKFRHGDFNRNALDDLRAALEQLLKALLGNDKSLENQLPAVGRLIKSAGGSPEWGNMFHALLDYYCSYQNRYVKHNDAVKEAEVEFVLEITSSFMKHLIRIRGDTV